MDHRYSYGLWITDTNNIITLNQDLDMQVVHFN